jgi:hypothetical protein
MDSLLTLKTWGEFSNKGATVGGKTYSSLEAAHDSVHVALGGHMSQQAFAGKLLVTERITDPCSDM